MMTIEENRKRIYRTKLILTVFFCIMIAGLSGAIFYYLRLQSTSTQLSKSEKILKGKTDSLNKATDSLSKMATELNRINLYLDRLVKQKTITDSLIALSAGDKNRSILNSLADSLSSAKNLAAIYEKSGYMKLKEKDLVAAKDAFNKSEKSYNGYHQVYEIWFLLYKNKDKLNDPVVKQQLLEQILARYNKQGFLKPADIE